METGEPSEHSLVDTGKQRKTCVEVDTGYPKRLGSSGKSVENSTKLTCLEITGYPIKYNTVLWLVALQIRRGRKVQTRYIL